MIIALLLAAALSPCEYTLAAGAEAAGQIEGRYFNRNAAILLETRLSEALEGGAFDDVCHDSEAFARDFSARANMIAGGDIISLRPTGPIYDDPLENWLAAGESVNWGVTRAEPGGDGAGHLRILDFYPLEYSGEVIDQALRALQGARTLVISLDGAVGGETETALALYAALAPEAARQTQLNIETRYDYSHVDIAAPATWLRLSGATQFVVVVSSNTGAAGRALATLLRMHAGAVIVGETTAGAGGYVYDTIDLDHGFAMELAVGAYRLGGTEAWPPEQVRPDIETDSLGDAMARAEALASRRQR